MITCSFKGWPSVSLRHVTCNALVVRDNKILLAKRSGTAISEPDKYCLPGGFMDQDETLVECVLRELQEETGYTGKVIALFSINDNVHRSPARLDRQNIDMGFLIEVGEKTVDHDHEISEVSWFELEAIDKLEIAFDHKDVINAYKRYWEKPFLLPIISYKEIIK